MRCHDSHAGRSGRNPFEKELRVIGKKRQRISVQNNQPVAFQGCHDRVPCSRAQPQTRPDND